MSLEMLPDYLAMPNLPFATLAPVVPLNQTIVISRIETIGPLNVEVDTPEP